MPQAYPFPPGRQKAGRKFTNYSPYEDALWQAINKAYYATYEGWTFCLHPTPGYKIDPERFREWQVKFCAASLEESNDRGDGKTTGTVIEDMPEHAWLWLYERMLRAEALIGAVWPSTRAPDG